MLRSGLPPQAVRVQEGTDQLVYVPEQSGRVYLYNQSTDQVIERLQVRGNQRFAVDSKAGRATLDGNEVSVGKLRGGDTYRIYFLAD